MRKLTLEVRPSHIESEEGRCWTVILPEVADGDSSESDESELVLFEDGRALGPAHALHDDIRQLGGGRFSHWGSTLYFSTSDNSDPRSSGRTYSIEARAREGYVPHKSVLRGHEVVPTFIGPGFLSQEMVDHMEGHPEAPGKSSWGTRNVLQAFILSLRPQIVVEVGTHIGSGAVVIGSALKANRYGHLYCLEPQDHYFRILSDNIVRAGLSDFVTPLQMMSNDPRLSQALPSKADIIFLDADHSYSSVMHDLALCDRMLNENGLLFLDDVGLEVSSQLDTEGRGGVRQALLDYSAGRTDWTVTLFDPPAWLNPCGLGMVCKQTVRSRL